MTRQLMATDNYIPPQPSRPPQPDELILPCRDLLSDDRRRDFISTCVPLCKAAIRGDWTAAERILQNNSNLVRYAITENYETVLSFAASTDNTGFVYYLLRVMDPEDLWLQTKTGDTALCLAAATGNVTMASMLLEKNPRLEKLSGSKGLTPLGVAALYGHSKMVKYLYKESYELEGTALDTVSSKQWLLTKCVQHNIFDIALKIIEKHGQLDQAENILNLLARKPSAFEKSKSQSTAAMQLLKEIWTTIMEKPQAEMDIIMRGPESLKDGRLTHSSRILFVATKMGNTAFVLELIRAFPDLMWKTNDDNQTIFHIAVSHRQFKIYSLLILMGTRKSVISFLRDSEENNMLHLVGKISEDMPRSGAKIVGELFWFKVVEQVVPTLLREQKNKDGLTPIELFTKTNKELISEGEKLVKEAASHGMLVSTLIATVSFAIVFAVPGGYNQNTGFPMFLGERTFLAFAIVDGISMISSATSVLMFLSIINGINQQDFVETVPKKMHIAVLMFFISILTMMAAFTLSFFLLFRERFIGVPISIGIFSLVPTVAYTKAYCEDIWRSTSSFRFSWY